GRGRHLYWGHAAQELRSDPERAGHLLRLRRALPALRMQLPPPPGAQVDRGGVRGRAMVLRGGERRISGGVQGLSGPARAPARGVSPGPWRAADGGILAGCATPARRGRGGGRLSLSPERAAPARSGELDLHLKRRALGIEQIHQRAISMSAELERNAR